MPTKPLDRLMFAQGERCFFCDLPLSRSDATVEHLVPRAKAGGNNDENRVACCKAVNALLGSRSIKEKIQVVLRQKGQFKCPNGSAVTPSAAARKTVPDKVPAEALNVVIANLKQRGTAKPRTLKTLTNTIATVLSRDFPAADPAKLVAQLQSTGNVTVNGTKVTYDF